MYVVHANIMYVRCGLIITVSVVTRWHSEECIPLPHHSEISSVLNAPQICY